MGFTLEAMRLPLEALGYEVIGELPVFSIFDRAKVKDNFEILIEATKLAQNLLKLFCDNFILILSLLQK